MQDALLVRRRKSRAQFARDLERLVGREPAYAPQQRAQVLAVDVFHREEVKSLHLAQVVYAADVRMRHLPRDSDLVAEAFERLFVMRHGFWKEFERDWLVQGRVVRAVDLAHSAFPQHGDDAVASAQQLARRELSLQPAARMASR